jgi:hypothetical protein
MKIVIPQQQISKIFVSTSYYDFPVMVDKRKIKLKLVPA